MRSRRTGWRLKALVWLQGDLEAWAKVLKKPTPAGRRAAQQALTHWQKDPDLATVRAPEALATLPEEERAKWQALWKQASELLREANADTSKDKKGTLVP